MRVLDTIETYAKAYPDRIAYQSRSGFLTYEMLWNLSDRLAAGIEAQEPKKKEPIAVYGHKSPWMLICFLACVKSGHAYCPIDTSVPDTRVGMILQALSSGLVLSPEKETVLSERWCEGKQLIAREQLEEWAGKDTDTAWKETAKEKQVSGEDIFYIIFTSGSTGVPKGVQITENCLGNYLDWSVTLGGDAKDKMGKVFLNQAPFSFDLSVMDLYTSLASAGTLYALEKQEQCDYAALMNALAASGAGIWVSTPSFAEICLSDPKFSGEQMPDLRIFLFCGETLANRTVMKLHQRFPEAAVVNTYGPTESTVAVTEVVIDEAMASQKEALPVGRARKGTRIEIWDENGKPVSEGEKGEIILIGDTVSSGYFHNEVQTQKAFFVTDGQRGYRTGDEGYLLDGMLHYCGRLDLQIKLHGYRIELEDIENNIRRLKGVEHAVVLPRMRAGKVSSLAAYVVMTEKAEQEKEQAESLKKELGEYLPSYMIPKKFFFLEQMPMTGNGKADRKRLAQKE